MLFVLFHTLVIRDSIYIRDIIYKPALLSEIANLVFQL